METIVDKVYVFFKKSFKKRLTIFISIPLIWSVLYLSDFYILPDFNRTDFITKVYKITLPHSVGGTSVRTDKKVGYKYITNNNFKFSNQDKNIGLSEVYIIYSPIFKTVKSVSFNNKQVKISSGFNGISKVLLIGCNITIIISFIYLYTAKKITENARLNLVFINILMLVFWIYIMIKFGI